MSTNLSFTYWCSKENPRLPEHESNYSQRLEFWAQIPQKLRQQLCVTAGVDKQLTVAGLCWSKSWERWLKAGVQTVTRHTHIHTERQTGDIEKQEWGHRETQVSLAGKRYIISLTNLWAAISALKLITSTCKLANMIRQINNLCPLNYY